MTRRILSRLSYANVMATVAVFFALGGGAWAVVKGSGTITSRNLHGIGGSATRVASLHGIGEITALCDQFGLSLNFVNHSGRNLRVAIDEVGTNPTSSPPAPNVISSLPDGSSYQVLADNTNNFYNDFTYHVYPPGGAHKPIATLFVSTAGAAGECTGSDVAVQAISNP
jgi:hypothetical protein